MPDSIEDLFKDFSKITKPLMHLLQKDVAFDFDEKCLAAFRNLKSALVSAPMRTMCGSRTGGWSLPCVMSD
jgi:hypothetical protein